jgi:hypothetical protein
MTGFKRWILSSDDMECYLAKMGRYFDYGLNSVVVPRKGGPKAALSQSNSKAGTRSPTRSLQVLALEGLSVDQTAIWALNYLDAAVLAPL